MDRSRSRSWPKRSKNRTGPDFQTLTLPNYPTNLSNIANTNTDTDYNSPITDKRYIYLPSTTDNKLPISSQPANQIPILSIQPTHDPSPNITNITENTDNNRQSTKIQLPNIQYLSTDKQLSNSQHLPTNSKTADQIHIQY